MLSHFKVRTLLKTHPLAYHSRYVQSAMLFSTDNRKPRNKQKETMK